MLVVCAGMPKSGSRWFYHLVDNLLSKAGFSGVADIIDSYRLHSRLKFQGNIGALTEDALSVLMSPPVSGHTFAVKTHFEPTGYVAHLIREGRVKALYISRDTRDVLLSALDAGKKLREKGRTEYFARLFDFEDALQWIGRWLEVYDRWIEVSGVYALKYEDLVAGTHAVMRLVSDYLEVDVSDELLASIIRSSDPSGKTGSGTVRSMHFNKGIIARHKKEMTSEQKRQCLGAFGHYLEKMGYDE